MPCAFPGQSAIRRVEIVYRSEPVRELFIPYYRFLVELPEDLLTVPEGMKHFGAYYVPAIESAYIENMPQWDGSFGA